MKKAAKRLCAVFMSFVMLFSMTAVVQAGEGKTPPGTVSSVVSENNWRLFFTIAFEDASDWLSAITEVSTGDKIYEKVDSIDRSVRWMDYIWNADAADGTLYISDQKDGVTTFTVKAEGYPDAVIELGGGVYNSAYGVTNYNSPVIRFASDEPGEPDVTEKKSIELSQISLGTDFFQNQWELSFSNAEEFAKSITAVTVNDEEWESYFVSPSSGGKYYADEGNNKLVFAKNNYGSTPVLKSGDVIRIENDAYETISFKLLIDAKQQASLVEDDGKGDPYQLYLKLDGSFEAAIVGQKEYDAVSAATGSISTSKSSSAVLYSALVEGDCPADDSEAWTELNLQNGLQVETNTAKVDIVPDVENGTNADQQSGLSGIYLRLSSGISLTGTPKDAGRYLVSVTLSDTQGRTATSNAIPLVIYSGNETLAEQLVYDNLTPTVWDGKYMWKDMEPWTIRTFGSNVDGENESVRVPEKVKAWYGSSESGLYGNLGYAIPWEDVENGNIPQTLYIPSGCNLTLVNMEIQSSVRIVVEDGGKLILRDSVVQGIIDVQSGGTFSMNYNDFGEESEFLTGASVDGQIRLMNGAILENAAIYSHSNYIANGDVDGRNINTPVVTATGDVTVKGQVFIRGDESGTKGGQTGLLVKDGTVTLEDDAVLAVYGGDAKVTLYYDGGDAVVLENGTITGNGKLIAIGGAPFWGNGGDAVRGNGTIDTREAFLQGATAKSDGPTGAKTPGKAVSGEVSVKSGMQHKEDGSGITVSESLYLEYGDPLYDLYWKTGIDATPDLTKYPTKEAEPADDDSDKDDDSQKDDDSDKDEDSDKDDDSGKGDDSDKNDDSGKDDDTDKNDDSGKDDDSDKNDDSGKDDDSDKDNDSNREKLFDDVDDLSGWRYDSIKFVKDNGIMLGIAGTNDFQPDHPIKREMFATMLYRMENSPAVTYVGKFADVQEPNYYVDPVAWGSQNDIIKGHGDTGLFGVDENITREDLVVLMYRYLKFKGYEAGNAASLDRFADASSVSDYATEAMQWAVGNGLIAGRGDTGTIDPQGHASRVETAAILMRFMNHMK